MVVIIKSRYLNRYIHVSVMHLGINFYDAPPPPAPVERDRLDIFDIFHFPGMGEHPNFSYKNLRPDLLNCDGCIITILKIVVGVLIFTTPHPLQCSAQGQAMHAVGTSAIIAGASDACSRN